MTAWSTDHARKTYSIPHWAGGYFDVDAQGRIVVRPRGAGGPAIALPCGRRSRGPPSLVDHKASP